MADAAAKVGDALDALLPRQGGIETRLFEAMRYATLGGGKRFRPFLLLESARMFLVAEACALRAAAALEMVHCYSLIHDDLPAMDDDDMRRGRPTTHKEFDEATAILAGDALLTHAFALIARSYAGRPALAVALSQAVAEAAGSERLIGGQMADILAEKKNEATAAELEFIHRTPTGAMLEVSLLAGGLCGGASETQLTTLREAGASLGLAFQIVDDLLDVDSTPEQLGKTPGKDLRSGKATFVKIHGIDASRHQAATWSGAAVAALRRLPGDTSFLASLARSMLERTC